MSTPRFALAARPWLFALTAVVVGACSSSDESTRATLAQGCTLNTDCASPLVCAFAKCHDACTDSRDCPAGERCVASDRPFRVCQQVSERTCNYNSECAQAQVCAVDGQCRDECRADSDCGLGQTCVSGACADPTELDAGKLPPREVDAGADADAAPPATSPCVRTSDCDEPLVCLGQRCVFECLADRDCAAGSTCEVAGDHRCHAPVVDAGVDAVADAGTDAQSCAYNSECAPPFVCHFGHCGFECMLDVDCAEGMFCASAVDHRCHLSPVDAGVDAAVEASDDASLDVSVDVSADAAPDAAPDADPNACPALGWTRPCTLCPDGAPGTQTCSGDVDAGLFWSACELPPSSVEVCDGKDNDCNGATDDGVGFGCTLGETRACTPMNCTVTTGTQSCINSYGRCQWEETCRAGTELCNGLDDDCDGIADDGPGMSCALGSRPTACTFRNGACSAPGVPTCTSSCTVDCAPALETCNGADDDCDGTTDSNAALGIACPQGVTEPCTVSACSTTYAGSRVCSSACQWGQCVVADVCNDADDTCDGRVDEGDRYATIVSNTNVAPTSYASGFVVVESGRGVFIAWSDARLGANRLSVGEFDLNGTPITPTGDVGLPSYQGIAGYGSTPEPARGVVVGGELFVVSTTGDGTALVLVRATPGSTAAPPTLKATVLGLAADALQLRPGGLATDGTTLLLSYAATSTYAPPYDLRVARLDLAGGVVSDSPLASGANATANAIFDGAHYLVARCEYDGRVHTAQVDTNGTITIADRALDTTECSTSPTPHVALAIANGVVGAAYYAWPTTFQFVTLGADGNAATGPFRIGSIYSGSTALLAGRAAAPTTFALGNAYGIVRFAVDGHPNSPSEEPGVLPYNDFQGALLYPPGGPVSFGASYQALTSMRDGCP